MRTVGEVVTAAEAAIQDEIASIAKLSELASQQPYYKNNFMWTRNVQDVVGIHGKAVYGKQADALA